MKILVILSRILELVLRGVIAFLIQRPSNPHLLEINDGGLLAVIAVVHMPESIRGIKWLPCALAGVLDSGTCEYQPGRLPGDRTPELAKY